MFGGYYVFRFASFEEADSLEVRGLVGKFRKVSFLKLCRVRFEVNVFFGLIKSTG